MVAVGLSSALQSLGADVSIYTTTAMSSHEGRVDIDEMPSGSSNLDIQIFPLSLSKRFAYSPQLSKVLKEKTAEFDIIHIHGLFQFPQFAGYRAAQRAHLPYVVSPHGSLDPHLRPRGKFRKSVVHRIWQREMFANAPAIHFTTEAERNLTLDLKFTAPAVVIPIGFDLARFLVTPAQEDVIRARRAINLTDGPVIVNHGRLHSKKGISFLVDAMVKVRQRYPSAQLLHIGQAKGDYYEALKVQIASLGLQDAVVFAGSRSGQDLLDLLCAADVWALPSYAENFGIAVIEAIALGLPTISTNRAAIALEASAEGGCLISEQTADAFAEAIIRVLENQALRDSLSKSGKAFASRFDWQIIGSEFLNLYSRLVQK